MQEEDAIKFFAKKIVDSGNTKDGAHGCLVPSDYSDNPKGEYAQASDVLFEKYQATHFTHKWVDFRQGQVLFCLYGGDSFGACLDLKKIMEIQVEI